MSTNRYIEGKWKKYTLNKNISMVMYALVHTLQQQKFEKKL